MASLRLTSIQTRSSRTTLGSLQPTRKVTLRLPQSRTFHFSPPSGSANLDKHRSADRGDGSRRRLVINATVGFLSGAGIMLYMGWRDNSIGAEGSHSPNTIHCDSAPDPLIHDRASDVGEEVKQRSESRGGGGVIGDAWDPSRPKEVDDENNPMRIRMAAWLAALQDHIVTSLEALEASEPPNEHSSTLQPVTFRRDHWIRPNNGGEGASCVIKSGRIFEKGGVNVSIVQGKLPPAAIKQMKADHKSLNINVEEALPYMAAGISIVLHPWNPHVPTVHMNYRYFEVDPPSTTFGEDAGSVTTPGHVPEPTAWWFGGGSDLTPNYLYEEDAKSFHQTFKDAADQHHSAYYPAWKKWCDKYFYIPHRGESRGVGGIFFDDLTTQSEIHQIPSDLPKGLTSRTIERISSILPSSTPTLFSPPTPLSSSTPQTPPTPSEVFSLVQTISSAFIPSYVPIVKRRKDAPYTEEERRWQLLRRGRYVEFNLVHDRGTKFGMFSPGARIEAVLMSLPETARWEYMSTLGTEEGTREKELMDVLKTPREWL